MKQNIIDEYLDTLEDEKNLIANYLSKETSKDFYDCRMYVETFLDYLREQKERIVDKAEIPKVLSQNNGEYYYVFNPNAGKPRKQYRIYTEALQDAAKVADKENEKVLVLKVITGVKIKKQTLIQDSTMYNSKEWELIDIDTITDDEIPF